MGKLMADSQIMGLIPRRWRAGTIIISIRLTGWLVIIITMSYSGLLYYSASYTVVAGPYCRVLHQMNGNKDGTLYMVL